MRDVNKIILTPLYKPSANRNTAAHILVSNGFCPGKTDHHLTIFINVMLSYWCNSVKPHRCSHTRTLSTVNALQQPKSPGSVWARRGQLLIRSQNVPHRLWTIIALIKWLCVCVGWFSWLHFELNLTKCFLKCFLGNIFEGTMNACIY